MAALAANALVVIADLKAWLNLVEIDANRDAFLQTAIDNWSDSFEKATGRVIKTAAYTDERHDGGAIAVLPVNIPVTTLTSLKINDTVIGTDLYYLDNSRAIIRQVGGTKFNGGRGSIKLAYSGGYTTVPGDIQRAFLQILALEYYLSPHGRAALSKRSESVGIGSTSYERGPEDQMKIFDNIVMRYKRRVSR